MQIKPIEACDHRLRRAAFQERIGRSTLDSMLADMGCPDPAAALSN